MQAFYADQFVLPLPEGHRFPMGKYSRLRERLSLVLPGLRMQAAPAASDGELALAHTPAYIHAVCSGTLPASLQREIGFPWSEAMVERSRRSAGATIAAARVALTQGLAGNLAGGTHHAYADRGSGFCVFNDVVVAARRMQAESTRRGEAPLRVAVMTTRRLAFAARMARASSSTAGATATFSKRIVALLSSLTFVIESWRRHYNAVRPHASLGYRPPAPEVFVPAFTAWPPALARPAAPTKRPMVERPTAH